MTTTKTEIDNTDWYQVTTLDTFIVQNISGSSIHVALSDAKPTDDNAYLRLNPGEAIDSRMVQGTVWAVTKTGSATVSTTE